MLGDFSPHCFSSRICLDSFPWKVIHPGQKGHRGKHFQAEKDTAFKSVREIPAEFDQGWEQRDIFNRGGRSSMAQSVILQLCTLRTWQYHTHLSAVPRRSWRVRLLNISRVEPLFYGTISSIQAIRKKIGKVSKSSVQNKTSNWAKKRTAFSISGVSNSARTFCISSSVIRAA